MSSNLIFGQRAIFSLQSELRSRINGLFMAAFFVGGAVAAAMSGWAYSHFRWPGVSVLGLALPVARLLYLATEKSHPAQQEKTCQRGYTESCDRLAPS